VDFALDEAQQAVADLADQILADRIDMELLRGIEERGAWFDADLWASLATAGLLGITLGEDVGGSGLDAVALAILLRAQGNHVAPLPLLPHGVASLAVERFGSGKQRRHLLPGCADGSIVLTVAVQEYLDDRIREPGARVVDGALHGTKIVVEAADLAGHAVVTATGDDGPGLFLVDLSSGGIDIRRTEGRSTRLEPVWQLDFDGTPAEPLGGADAAPVDWLVDHLLMAICATQLGVTERALRLTAEYTSEREQFGRPLATFQAVTQRLADQFVNVGGIRLATLSAAWRLAQGLDAREDLLIAKWWASERATEVAHATQHCHGGMGVAKDYPLHRYTLWNKHLTTSLGAGTQSLRALGSLLAEA
jgi:acyl-CoA dehydrogenase